ncbi:Heat-labile enterotoxin, A chain, partial [Metarhizium majus ARSEF 297]
MSSITPIARAVCVSMPLLQSTEIRDLATKAQQQLRLFHSSTTDKAVQSAEGQPTASSSSIQKPPLPPFAQPLINAVPKFRQNNKTPKDQLNIIAEACKPSFYKSIQKIMKLRVKYIEDRSIFVESRDMILLEVTSNCPCGVNIRQALSSSSYFIAMANTSARVALQAQNADKPKIQAGALDVANQITAEISPMIIRRQCEFLLKLPQLVLRDTKLSLQPIAEQFNRELIEHMTSESMVRQYTPLVPAIDGQPLGDEEHLRDQTRGSLHGIGDHLKKNPPPLPKLFDIAYVLGQSKGMLDINPLSLSPREFIKSQAPDLSQDDVDFYSLHHALQISLLLRGKLTEDKLSKLWPSDDENTVQQLQPLLALKFGKIYDEQKVFTHLNIPPHGRDEESMAYLGLILDLSKERIKSIPRHKEVIGFKDLGTDAKLITAMLEHAKELYIKRVDEEAVAMQDDKANEGEKPKSA